MCRKLLALLLSSGLVLALSGCSSYQDDHAVKHVVVIYDENVSFDHYFGTYPNATNTGGTTFTAAAGTPIPNNYISNPSLLTANPNLLTANLSAAANSMPSNPFRLAPTQAATGDQDHQYGPEQLAFDDGKMDLFPFSVGNADASALMKATAAPGLAGTTALTMGYFDGNTVTALWNYAQHYALSDHFFGTSFGPSTPGAINLISGTTNGATVVLSGAASATFSDGQGGLTLIGDADPAYDVCSSSSATVQMTSKNIGDLLNAAGVSWGFFQGGFNLTATNRNNSTGCGRSTASGYIPGNPGSNDYSQHHQPFQYYASTSNPTHARPTGAIGTTDAANHQYDIADFNAALAAGNMPAVSFLKPPSYQDGHAGNSDPLDEQTFLATEINAIEASPFWSSTAIIIAYDDSDGWYDHLHNVVNGSQSAADYTICNSLLAGSTAPAPGFTGVNTSKPVNGRCGYGPRLPLLVISPWAKTNYIDSTVTDQSSITRFIEDIFLNGTRLPAGSADASAGSLMNMFSFPTTAYTPTPAPVFISPSTGAVCSSATCK
jgi:phospholipase C